MARLFQGSTLLREYLNENNEEELFTFAKLTQFLQHTTEIDDSMVEQCVNNFRPLFNQIEVQTDEVITNGGLSLALDDFEEEQAMAELAERDDWK